MAKADVSQSAQQHGGTSEAVTGQNVMPGANSSDRSDGGRNTLRSIILGLLGAHPMTGYDIKGAFDRSLATYWNAGSSQIYTTLKALAAGGLVTSELVEQQGRPNRRVYRLTDAGHAALDGWLREPVPDRFTKDEFLTKLFFCGQTDDSVALGHLEAHLDALYAQLAHMEWVLREFGERPTRRPRLLEYQLLVRDYKQAALQTDIAVTLRAIARLRGRRSIAEGSEDAKEEKQ